MRILKITSFVLCVASLSLAQAAPSAEKPQGGNVRFNADMLDKNIDPCTDFYAYACGKWKAQNPIPADRSEWGRFDELEERGEAIIRNILEKSAMLRDEAPSNRRSATTINPAWTKVLLRAPALGRCRMNSRLLMHFNPNKTWRKK